jgi:hypothetical protein
MLLSHCGYIHPGLTYMYKDLRLEIPVHRAQIRQARPGEQQTAGSAACKMKGAGISSTDAMRQDALMKFIPTPGVPETKLT